ncbi:hypothetical protein Trydic_g23032 [Trypoxylus dichotomus]
MLLIKLNQIFFTGWTVHSRTKRIRDRGARDRVFVEHQPVWVNNPMGRIHTSWTLMEIPKGNMVSVKTWYGSRGWMPYGRGKGGTDADTTTKCRTNYRNRVNSKHRKTT